MPTGGYLTGNEGKLYQGAAGSQATNEITGVTTVKVNSSRKTATVETRGDDVELNLFGNKQITVDVEMPWNSSDANMIALRNAHKTKAPIAIYAIAEDSGLGADGDMGVASFDHDQPLNDGQKVSIKLVPHAKGTRKVTLT